MKDKLELIDKLVPLADKFGVAVTVLVVVVIAIVWFLGRRVEKLSDQNVKMITVLKVLSSNFQSLTRVEDHIQRANVLLAVMAHSMKISIPAEPALAKAPLTNPIEEE